MFRRLAELEGFDIGQTQTNFVSDQTYRYNTLLPNLIPTAGTAPAPQGLQEAVRSVNPVANATLQPVPDVQNIFVPNSVPKALMDQQQVCQAGSLDGILASQDPSKPIRCGWAYSPPPNGSPIPTLSQGVLGTADGPFSFTTPQGSYSQWFWDLNDAKKQVLIDTCKAMKSCSDVNSEPFAGKCGYCPDIGQGIPIDKNGQPLYTNSPLTTCSPDRIITSASNCEDTSQEGTGLQTRTNNVCTPIGGRLPFGCLETIIEQAGCSSDGALSIALSSGATPNDYMNDVRKLKSMQIYNERSSKPFNLDMFAQGKTTQALALAEVKQLAANASKPETSALGASARDLCIQKGALDKFDFCSEINLNSPPPFNIECLQNAFLKAGGNSTGRMYPNPQTMASYYNTLPNWKAAIDYINGLAFSARGPGAVKEGFDDMLFATQKRYQSQADALLNLQGITPEKLSKRSPFAAGVETFWFNTFLGVLLNVTIEGNFPTLPSWGWGTIPQVGFHQFAQFIALTDIRAKKNENQLKFQIETDDGFMMSLNQPVFGDPVADRDGYFARNYLQAPTVHRTQSCWNLSTSQPNIMKAYWHDKGGGHHTFILKASPCNSMQYNQVQNVSITRELRGPFMMFENVPGGEFADLRIPEYFNFKQNGNTSTNIAQFADTDSKLRAPGKHGYIRLSSGVSNLTLKNISMNTWTTFTFAFRVNVMPVNDFFVQMNLGGANVQLYLSPVNGSTAVVNYYTTLGGANPQMGTKTGVMLNLGVWYLCSVTQLGRPANALNVSFMNLDNAANRSDMWFTSNNMSQSFTITNRGAPVTFSPHNSTILLGSMSNVAVLQWDVAWWHFFNTSLNGTDMQREAKNNWMITLGQ